MGYSDIKIGICLNMFYYALIIGKKFTQRKMHYMYIGVKFLSNFSYKFLIDRFVAMSLHIFLAYFKQCNIQYRPITTAHMRGIFRVVPLVFIA